ncbi:MAG: hypothetical protein B6241_14740 [Spirochaetaceae bacterium 4572_59]|nr:MAG: hypothetical protein B6241_14740 [Spirochaetaceae bacterium 4572_59]
MNSAGKLEDLKKVERETSRLQNEIGGSRAASLNEGLSKMAVMLAMQNVPGGNLQVPRLSADKLQAGHGGDRSSGKIFLYRDGQSKPGGGSAL